jgi:hypothetical protein
MSRWHQQATLDQLHDGAKHAPSSAAPAPAPVVTKEHDLLHDHAKDILQDAPSLSGEQRAIIWDAYHDSPTVSALARKLAELDVEIPPDVEAALLAAKKLSVPEPDVIDKVLDTMMRMDPNILALAESHPEVLRALIHAAKE